MSNRYRLVKEYPGSPKLESIVKLKDNGGYELKNSTSYFMTKDKVENYPEFWQPVIEKDYEILSLVASERNPQHKKGSKFLHNKDYKFKSMHPTEFWDIYSVKRISDNKIFTIGDFYEDLIIEKMFMSVAGDILTTYKPKIKQPIFQTEDAVDIFKGDKVYFVNTTNGRFNIDICLETDLYRAHLLYFSTKEKAEEYILMNKSCLSLNDVINNTVVSKRSLGYRKLEKLVQQKLNK